MTITWLSAWHSACSAWFEWWFERAYKKRETERKNEKDINHRKRDIMREPEKKRKREKETQKKYDDHIIYQQCMPFMIWMMSERERDEEGKKR